MRRLLVLGFLALACGSGEAVGPPPKTAAPSAPELPSDAVSRRDVLEVVHRGLGRFLQHVDVEPRFVRDQFVGFQIMGLYPPALWEGIDLRVGDVVTSVNGMPIERETEAFEAFQALKTADRLTVAYLRDGKPSELTYRIVGQGERTLAPEGKPPSPPATGTPAPASPVPAKPPPKA